MKTIELNEQQIELLKETLEFTLSKSVYSMSYETIVRQIIAKLEE